MLVGFSNAIVSLKGISGSTVINASMGLVEASRGLLRKVIFIFIVGSGDSYVTFYC